MAIGPDRVQVYKSESSARGGDAADDFGQFAPIPIEPSEDAIECAGVYLQEPGKRDELVAVFRHNDAIWVMDKHYPSGRPLEVLFETDGSFVLTLSGEYIWEA